MSTQPHQDGLEPDEGEHRPQSADSIRNTTVALEVADNNGLLAVLRDLTATVKRLEAHVAASSKVSSLEDATTGKAANTALENYDEEYKVSMTSSFGKGGVMQHRRLVSPEGWHPLIDKLATRELSQVKACLLLPDLVPDNYNQINSVLGGKTQLYLKKRGESLDFDKDTV